MPIRCWPVRAGQLESRADLAGNSTESRNRGADHRVATNLRGDLADASHLAGVVLLSCPAVALGAANSMAEDQTTRSTTECGLRRLISARTIRVTVVVPLRDNMADQQKRWTAAYAAEPEWLSQDLSGRGSRNSPPSWVEGRQFLGRSA